MNTFSLKSRSWGNYFLRIFVEWFCTFGFYDFGFYAHECRAYECGVYGSCDPYHPQRSSKQFVLPNQKNGKNLVRHR